MTLDWLTPSALWGLLLVPIVWATGHIWMGGRSVRARWGHALVRSMLIAVVVAAVAEPVVSRTAARLSIVYAVDVSHSVSARAIESVADQIDALSSAITPEESRILVFGRGEVAVAGTTELRGIGGAQGEAVAQAAGPESTNLEQALAAARAEVPAGTSGRIVLFTDGRETEGDVRRVLDRLAAEQIPVFVQVMPSRDLGDTWIEAVRVRGPAVARTPSALDVVVGSQVETVAELVVRDGARTVARRQISVPRGESVQSFDVMFDAPGPHVVEARIDTSPDVIQDNDILATEVVVAARTRVLYVRGDPADGSVAASALVQAGALLTSAAPEALPRTAAGFDRWDVIVLSNVARAQLPPSVMSAMATWVEERGGGLLFVGGSRVVGESADRAVSGYRRTEIERILPVTFERDDEPEVALVIVLDRSWSMNGLAMDLSKTAAEAAANTLAPTQMLGILTFNNLSTWDVPLSRVRDSRPTLRDAISRIAASGATAIYPALAQAYEALGRVRARAKHVILLSDGQTEPQDYEGLVKQMSAARMTVSSVALGSEADVTLLRNIATWGGGRHYVVADATQIPEIFVREAKNAETPGAEEGGEIALTVRQPEFLGAAAASLPSLAGRNTVTRKPEAIELIGTTRGDPLLVTWPVGLGRTAMLATDLDGRWSSRWLRWRGFGGVLSTVVRSLAAADASPIALRVEAGERRGEAQEVRIAIDARDRDGRPRPLTDPRVTLRGQGAAVTVRLTEVGAARYETRLMADTSAPIAVSLSGEAEAAVPSRILVTDQAAEYRFGPANGTLVRAIAESTGGAVDALPGDIGRHTGTGTVRYALAPWLLGMALVLWPMDIAIRRRWR